jgi:putative ABC transport system substrate-binding protein
MKRDADAVMVVTAPFIWVKRSQFSELALRYRLPTMHDSGGWTEDGGLVSYGPNTAAVWRRAAHFVDRILKGGKAADMPIEQPRNFELIINLKTAKALDLKIPQHLLLLADRIIE